MAHMDGALVMFLDVQSTPKDKVSSYVGTSNKGFDFESIS